LFKDGIGEITFHPKSVGQEVDRLVEMLADELHSLGGDEDIVTRLWNANFEHIGHRVLDDYLSEQFGTGSTDAASEARSDETSDHAELLPDLPSFTEKGRIIVDHTTTLGSIDTYMRGLATQHHHQQDAAATEASYQRTLRSCFNVTGEETALYRTELEHEKTEDGIASFTEAIIVFTLMVDPTAVRDVVTVLERLIEYALHEKSPATLERVVRLVKGFRAREDLTDNVRQYCDWKPGAQRPELVGLFLNGAGADARRRRCFLRDGRAPALDAGQDAPPRRRTVVTSASATPSGYRRRVPQDVVDMSSPRRRHPRKRSTPSTWPGAQGQGADLRLRGSCLPLMRA
jgi:hypothetical protein